MIAKPLRAGLAAFGATVFLGACGDGPGTAEPDPVLSATCGAEDVRLAVGGVARPAAGGAGCRFAPSAGAEYVLAHLDPRPLARARTGPEPDPRSALPEHRIAVTVEGGVVEAGGPQALLVPGERGSASAGAAPLADARAADGPFARATPWALGERFSLDYQGGGARTARVVRIYEGGIVVAWYEDDSPQQLPRLLAQLDSAMPAVRAHALPLLRHVFVDAPPRTSPGSGQYLVALRSYPGSGPVASAAAALVGGQVHSWVLVGIAPFASHASLASVLAHEMTHSYQLMRAQAWDAETGRSGASAPFWGFEGGADLIGTEVLRRQAGLRLDGNFDWRQPGPDAFAAWWARRAHPGTGSFLDGYDDAAGFLRDLVARRVAAGEPVDDAVREVSRGAVEGWYGLAAGGSARGGLVERMRARLGADWEPAGALLQWTLSHAADDLTDRPEYQNRAFLRIAGLPAGLPYGWKPDAVVRTGAGPAPGVARATRRHGSVGYMYLRDGGPGVRFSVQSDAGDAQWMVLRVR